MTNNTINKRIQFSKGIITYFLLTGMLWLSGGCSRSMPEHYLNGTVLENISWRVALKDSLNILTVKNGVWVLPEIRDTNDCKKNYTYYRKPERIKHWQQLGRIDQEEVNSSDTDIVRLYRFGKKGVMLAGYTSPDTMKPITIFEPPVVIRPSDASEPLTSHSLMKTWEHNRFDQGLRTTVTITPEEMGYFLNESGQKEKGELYKLTIARDATVQYGKHNLIVPDAVMMSSHILADKNGNLILEWGIRETPLNKAGERGSLPDSLSIEVTKYVIRNTTHELNGVRKNET